MTVAIGAPIQNHGAITCAIFDIRIVRAGFVITYSCCLYSTLDIWIWIWILMTAGYTEVIRRLILLNYLQFEDTGAGFTRWPVGWAHVIRYVVSICKYSYNAFPSLYIFLHKYSFYRSPLKIVTTRFNCNCNKERIKNHFNKFSFGKWTTIHSNICYKFLYTTLIKYLFPTY